MHCTYRWTSPNHFLKASFLSLWLEGIYGLVSCLRRDRILNRKPLLNNLIYHSSHGCTCVWDAQSLHDLQRDSWLHHPSSPAKDNHQLASWQQFLESSSFPFFLYDVRNRVGKRAEESFFLPLSLFFCYFRASWGLIICRSVSAVLGCGLKKESLKQKHLKKTFPAVSYT